MSARRFPARILAAIDESAMLRIRAGADHRFIGVWGVVVRRRVFIRSWNDKPRGWYRAFLDEPSGAIQIAGREISIRARPVRSEGVRDAVELGYASKYTTPASKMYVRGFKTVRRRNTTMELNPR